MILTFSFEVVSGHTITIQWYKDDVAVVDGTFDGVVVAGSTTNTMTITDPTAAWNGEYYAIVTDSTAECTTQTDPVDVEVPDVCALAITTQPVSQELEVGEDLELTVASSGSVGIVTYQWYLDGVALEDGASGDATISGATTATLSITSITEALAGDYTVILVDTNFADCSIESDVATVTVNSDTARHNADFDGTNDRLTRASLTGVATGKTFTFACWVRVDGPDDAQLSIIDMSASFDGASYFHVYRNSSNKIEILGRSATGATIHLTGETSISVTAASGWTHIYICVDLSDPTKRHIYIDDVEDMGVNWSVYNNSDINFTHGSSAWGIGGSGLGHSILFDGAMSELWFQTTYFDDPSKFISGGCPVDLGAAGETPTGVSPALYLSSNGSGDLWRVDSSGNGNDFAVQGELTTTTSPC
jgi:hypothetical protein